MTELEEADQAFTDRLVDRFNQAYDYRLALHASCDASAKAQIPVVARRGRDLASELAGGRLQTASAR